MFFTINFPELVNRLDDAQDGATKMLVGWISTNNCEALYSQWEPVQRDIDELLEMLPKQIPVDNLLRHCKFISRELKRKDKKTCTSDIINIATNDLNDIRQELIKKAEKDAYDKDLLRMTGNSLEEAEFDDAIRAAFLVLSKRLRRLGGPASHKLDGIRLVESLFGLNGSMQSHLGPKSCLALRDLLSGLYSTFRNRHSHHLGDVDGPEGVGVVLMIHYLLKDILKPKTKWTVMP